MKRQISAALTVAFLTVLAINASRSQVDYKSAASVEPQLTAGAAKFPVIAWQTTEVKEPQAEPQEVVTVANPVGEPTELIEEEEPQEEPQEQASYLLYRVVQAEGYTMGYEGMRYITSAILNLARDRGCSVEDVLTSGAYTVVNTGAIWRQEILPETIAAVDDDLSSQIDMEIKYFRTGHYHGFGTPCFTYENVYFSK